MLNSDLLLPFSDQEMRLCLWTAALFSGRLQAADWAASAVPEPITRIVNAHEVQESPDLILLPFRSILQ
jgi:hypothetical protein